MRKTRRNTVSRRASKTSIRPRDAVDVLDEMIGSDQELRELTDQATVDALVAQMIYQARTEVGLTQGQLAKLVGTRQPVISRLEDADYDGHSLSMLRRIAEALGKRLQIRFVDKRKVRPRAA